MEREHLAGVLLADDPLHRRAQRPPALRAPGRTDAASGAGHDAGILAPHLPSAMLYVRNPTGVSHAPEEACEDDDARAGVAALVSVLENELGVPTTGGAASHPASRADEPGQADTSAGGLR